MKVSVEVLGFEVSKVFRCLMYTSLYVLDRYVLIIPRPQPVLKRLKAKSYRL